MNLKGVFKAIGKALLYFGIYYGWQLIVVNWASMAASVYISASMDPLKFLPEGVSDAAELTLSQYQEYSENLSQWLTSEVLELINRYAMHLTLLSGILCVVTLVVIFKTRKKSLTSEVKLTRLKPQQAIIVLTLGVATNILVSFVMNLIPFPEQWMSDYIESATVADGNSLIAWVTTVISAPIVEELVFRGFCYNRLKRGMPMLAAMLLAAWGFGMVHGTVIWVLYASLFGFVLAWIYEKMQSLTACILLHFSFNLTGQLSALTVEISDVAFWTLLVSSALVTLALFLQIQRTSPYKIEWK